jgi:N-acyl-D-aspartate/D-glutamate deacylase
VTAPETTFELIVRGATVFDGSGAAGVRADVGVRGERIAAVGADLPGAAAREVDARGLALAPGFIDVHSHDDFAVLLQPEMPFKVLQGVTTDIVGNCGSGVVPFEAGLRRFRRLHPDANPGPWASLAEYMARVEDAHPALNVAVLVGHGSLRAGAMGLEQRPPSASELDRMRGWLREGLQAGAVGLSTGLVYEPGRYAATEEIIELAREVAPFGGVYATHMRNEASHLLDSVREAITIGEQAGVAVEISHHKASGASNWGRTVDSLALIDAARGRGLDVTADQYPYTAGSTSLFAVVQNGAFTPGASGGMGEIPPEGVLVASAPRHPAYEGQTIAELMEAWGQTAEGTANRLLDEEGEALFVVTFTMDEQDVRRVLAYPATMIGSDGVPAVGGKPHPRLWNCFARVLGHYVREQPVLDLPTAVHKMTGLPARKFHLHDRGEIRAGAVADMVVFDPARIEDVGTYADPSRPPRGMVAVFVGGIEVAREGSLTGARPGRVVRRGQ